MGKKNLFTQVEFTKIKSNVFDLSHDVKLSFKFGDLIPVMAVDCVPGDKFNISCDTLLRFAPLVAPVMHRIDLFCHYFFVPNRLLWPTGWEQYITGGEQGSSVPGHPFINVTAANWPGTPIFDYMGIPDPTGIPGPGADSINALPFAAYQLIYNEYYRDENLITKYVIELVNGNNNANITNLTRLHKRAWEHDYFTSCLPWAQKGDPVTLPISGFEDVAVLANEPPDTPGDSAVVLEGLGVPSGNNDDKTVPYGSPIGPTTDLYAETSQINSSAANITDLRRAFKIQEFLERAARGGTRYVEFLMSMFGVKSSDKRLNRPEFITGVKSPVVISEVLNTTGTVDAPQGAMAGHGVSVASGNYGSYYCEEHGWIIGIMSAIPKTAYQQGIAKKFLKINDRTEYYFEQFAHIGEQAVLNKEVYAYTATGTDTFGYIPRYSEYKFENNRTAGDFRTTLDYWTLTRQFATAPALNQDFIDCVPDTRIFAVEDGTDYLWCHIYHKVKVRRKMPYFGNPHF